MMVISQFNKEFNFENFWELRIKGIMFIKRSDLFYLFSSFLLLRAHRLSRKVRMKTTQQHTFPYLYDAMANIILDFARQGFV